MKNILTLLDIEFSKYRKNFTVTLVLGLFFILTPTLIFMGKRILVSNQPPLPSNRVFYEFPTVWEYNGFIGNWLTFFFLGYIAMYIITSEVSYRTMRQNIITGLTRKEYFLGKLAFIVTLSLIATGIYTLSCLLIGITHTEGWDWALALDTNYAVLRYFLLCMGYGSFGLMIAYLVRRSGLSIFLYFSYILIIEMILKWAVSLNIVARIDSIPNNLVNYWPLNTIEDLIPNPILRLPANFINSTEGFEFDVLLPTSHAIIGSSVWIVIFLGVSWCSFKRRDL